jgi:hypothetical protein
MQTAKKVVLSVRRISQRILMVLLITADRTIGVGVSVSACSIPSVCSAFKLAATYKENAP